MSKNRIFDLLLPLQEKYDKIAVTEFNARGARNESTAWVYVKPSRRSNVLVEAWGCNSNDSLKLVVKREFLSAEYNYLVLSETKVNNSKRCTLSCEMLSDRERYTLVESIIVHYCKSID